MSDVEDVMCEIQDTSPEVCIRHIHNYTVSCSYGNRLTAVCTSVPSFVLSFDLRTTLEDKVSSWLWETLESLRQLCIRETYITAWISSSTSCFNTTKVDTINYCDKGFGTPPPPWQQRRRPKIGQAGTGSTAGAGGPSAN
ncbi:hypothetical protein Vretimale_17422 [Volvox reticuliferus]|uniref:Uncharacterized protein n=1 Tax=Volvox reticuliferus TaxID=1737510 RepID=A0A8J4GSZ8_9CHLO|nr:hypothetical protein Vretifemale_9400 [Volvox reticuliferus]GIM14465.1 hypothetical protein Vretimale_17422 [Volvox reticuliferus]